MAGQYKAERAVERAVEMTEPAKLLSVRLSGRRFLGKRTERAFHIPTAHAAADTSESIRDPEHRDSSFSPQVSVDLALGRWVTFLNEATRPERIVDAEQDACAPRRYVSSGPTSGTFRRLRAIIARIAGVVLLTSSQAVP